MGENLASSGGRKGVRLIPPHDNAKSAKAKTISIIPNIFIIYFCQNEGKNRTSIANNSNLPKIIPRLSTHFEKSGNWEKLPFGPIKSPSPGPTFEIEVAAPEIEVVKSNPLRDNKAAIIKKIIM